MEPHGRKVLDVSGLPRNTVGPGEVTWWGNLGFMIVEGTTLLICAVAYIYLRRNFESWPPLRTPQPDVLVPTISLMLLFVSTWLAYREGVAARNREIDAMRKVGAISLTASAMVLVFRALEFGALNTRWDNDAYGSLLWFILGFHSTLLLLQFFEDTFYLYITFRGPVRDRHYGHIIDKAHYSVFVAAVWVPLYVMIYLAPRYI